MSDGCQNYDKGQMTRDELLKRVELRNMELRNMREANGCTRSDMTKSALSDVEHTEAPIPEGYEVVPFTNCKDCAFFKERPCCYSKYQCGILYHGKSIMFERKEKPELEVLCEIDPFCTFWPKGQCNRPYNELEACWNCDQEMKAQHKLELDEMKEKLAWLENHEVTHHAPKALEKDDMCPTCGKNPATEPHPCPYKSEINGNEEECTCCQYCQHECAMDI